MGRYSFVLVWLLHRNIDHVDKVLWVLPLYIHIINGGCVYVQHVKSPLSIPLRYVSTRIIFFDCCKCRSSPFLCDELRSYPSRLQHPFIVILNYTNPACKYDNKFTSVWGAHISQHYIKSTKSMSISYSVFAKKFLKWRHKLEIHLCLSVCGRLFFLWKCKTDF
jgi:hypothetical protein